MSDLNATIEQFDPGHFDRRRHGLLKASEKLKKWDFSVISHDK